MEKLVQPTAPYQVTRKPGYLRLSLENEKRSFIIFVCCLCIWWGIQSIVAQLLVRFTAGTLLPVFGLNPIAWLTSFIANLAIIKPLIYLGVGGYFLSHEITSLTTLQINNKKIGITKQVLQNKSIKIYLAEQVSDWRVEERVLNRRFTIYIGYALVFTYGKQTRTVYTHTDRVVLESILQEITQPLTPTANKTMPENILEENND
ncbi:MAG TPA: hypothetical protein PK299_03015 [Anaerolineales bacterium]|nr:hypothetical protein [Anaerolineales bacterium]